MGPNSNPNSGSLLAWLYNHQVKDRISSLPRPVPSAYWMFVLTASIGMLAAWFLPFCTLEMTGSVGGGEEQVVRDFSKTVWSWDLSIATVPVLLAPLILFGVAWLGRRNSESTGLITLALLIALSANTYLAASIADRDWREIPTPAAVAEPEPTPRCELVTFPPAEFHASLS